MFLFKFLKPVIDYVSLVIDYQRGFSENNFQETYLFKCFMNGHSNVLKRVFIAQTVLSSRKIKSFSELKCLILSKRFLGQPLAYSIRNFWLIFILQSTSFTRDLFFSSSYFWKGIKRPWVSCCRGFLNTREGLSLCALLIRKERLIVQLGNSLCILIQPPFFLR